jgi:hypothetical protein
MTDASDENLARKHRKIFAFASVAGATFIAGLFAYYGSLVYQARGYEGFARFSNVMIAIGIGPGAWCNSRGAQHSARAPSAAP